MPKSSWMLLCFLSSAIASCGNTGATEIVRELDADSAITYLLSCQKENGAFGPIDQEYSDLAWNYPAVHALLLLGADIPRVVDCLRNGQWAAFRHKDSHPTNLHWDLYQRAHLNLLLAPKIPEARANVFASQKGDGIIELGKHWKLQYVDRKLRFYGPYGLGVFHDLSSLWYMTRALTSLDGRIDNVEVAKEFVRSRQCANGGFVNAYRVDSRPRETDAHVVITYHAVMTLKALGLPVPKSRACIDWIRSTQTPSGGFGWSPTHDSPSNRPDVWYTWAAVRALDALGSEPEDAEACIRWINSLQNQDGGFGDRPGWNSRLYSTYYAVHALKILAGNARQGISRKEVASTPERAIPEGKYSIFQAHLKSPAVAKGSQSQMVEGVRQMRLHLVGAKTHNVDEARAYVKRKGYVLDVVACPENYHHNLRWLGGQPANHISNWIIPPEMTEEERLTFNAADQAGKKGLPWSEFKEQVTRPMLAMGTLIYPEMDYSMVNAYMVYDDGLDGQSGYNAIELGTGWPPWDWVRHFPYRERWIGKLPAVADGDAHGDLAEWGGRLDKMRILFIAAKHDLPHFLEALRNQRSVCAIRDENVASGVVLYGSAATVDYIKKHRRQWQWW